MQIGPRGASRPTIRCLSPLGLSLPPIDHSLEDLDHPLVVKSQTTALACVEEPQNQPRILKIIDGHWYKVKVNNWRGGLVAEQLPDSRQDEEPSFTWWLGMAGQRSDDSPQNDFYACLPVQAQEFLPADLDWKRLKAELALQEVDRVRNVVRSSVWRSHRSQELQTYTHTSGQRHFGIKVTVRRPDEIYVSVGGHTITDPRWFTTLLGALPEISAEFWLAEPSSPLSIELDERELVYSAVLPEGLIDQLDREAQQHGWNPTGP